MSRLDVNQMQTVMMGGGQKQAKEGGEEKEPEAPDVVQDVHGVSKAEVKGALEEREIITPSSRRLFSVKSVLPPEFWIVHAEELVIDEIKVSFVHRPFILSEQVRSVLIKDIKNVQLESNVLFATVRVFSGGEPKQQVDFDGQGGNVQVKMVSPAPEMIRFLDVEQAKKVRRIIEGLVIMDQQKVDTAKLTVEQIVGHAEELGKAR